MKSICLSQPPPTLSEVLDLAGQEDVVLHTPDGRSFAVVEVHDFAREVEAVRRNGELMKLLEERSAAGRLSLDDVRKQFGHR